MNTMKRNRIQNVVLLVAMIAMLAGCDRAEQTVDSAENRVPDDQPAGEQQPLGNVMEFDGFTLRANVVRTDVLPAAMARQYGIDPEPDLVLLNLVILENQPDRQPETVSAEVSAQHESLVGHVEAIDMRAVESDGHISYIGTLDAGADRFYQIFIEAQPSGTDQPLRMNFEVQLDTFDVGDNE